MLPYCSTHKFSVSAAQHLKDIKDASVNLVITSPPYPMIEMWDDIFASQNKDLKKALEDNDDKTVFELIHQELDKVWLELNRVLFDGGIACINMGDATRTFNSKFALYSNHSRIIQSFIDLGFTNLPNIIWRKQTNAPNKFMGSGMLPAGAYVTLEHEWILIFRKGNKRLFKTPEEKLKRKQSAFFWEERNKWFSDLWDLKGIKQNIKTSETRNRTAAFPFEIPYRLINMYSCYGDTILDPFAGTGTTTLAALLLNRNSIAIDIDKHFIDLAKSTVLTTPKHVLKNHVFNRLKNHNTFISERISNPAKSDIKYLNTNFNLPVITSQEKDMKLFWANEVFEANNMINANYKELNIDDVEKIVNANKEEQISLNL